MIPTQCCDDRKLIFDYSGMIIPCHRSLMNKSFDLRFIEIMDSQTSITEISLNQQAYLLAAITGISLRIPLLIHKQFHILAFLYDFYLANLHDLLLLPPTIWIPDLKKLSGMHENIFKCNRILAFKSWRTRKKIAYEVNMSMTDSINGYK